MRIIKLITILGALAVTPILQAQQQQDPGQAGEQETVTVPIKANEVGIILPAKYRKMWPEEFSAYRGRYTLSNGRELTVMSRGTNMYAFIDGDEAHKIVAIAPNVFVALDQQLKMEINLLDKYEVSGSVTMVVRGDRLANGDITPDKIVYYALR